MRKLFALLIATFLCVALVGDAMATLPTVLKRKNNAGEIVSYAYNDTVYGTGGSSEKILEIPAWAQGGEIEVMFYQTSSSGTADVDCYAAPGWFSDGLKFAYVDSARVSLGSSHDEDAWGAHKVMETLAVGLDSILILSKTVTMGEIHKVVNKARVRKIVNKARTTIVDTFVVSDAVGDSSLTTAAVNDSVFIDAVTDSIYLSGTNYTTEYARVIPSYSHVKIYLAGSQNNAGDTIVYIVVSFIAPESFIRP